MQDTSTSQYELIQLLTQSWDGHSQTVFLVGDPKQSIYLFRQARVERFVTTMQTGLLGDLPVGRLQLTANFRSQRKLVEAFNDDFSLLFQGDVNTADPGEVPYVEAHAVRGPSKSKSLNLVWHAHVLAPTPSTEAAKRAKHRQTKLEAQQVRSIIEVWQAKPLPEGRSEPWKLAVLVRSRNLLTDIVTELKNDSKGAIPFRAVEIEPLGKRQEVLDLFALTRALMHPVDRTAWLAVLHAPWCGLGRADLHMLAGGDDPIWSERCMLDVIAERGHLLSELSCASLMRVWSVMRAAEDNRSGLSMAQCVERTWRSLGGDAYLKPAELVNAQRYLQLLDEVEAENGRVEVGLLKRQLDKLFANPPASDWAVDLMTIHKSKGLEWDVVMVPGLHTKDPSKREKLLNWSEIESGDANAARIMLAPIVGRGESSRELNDWLKSMDKAKEAAERKRLFYVACTRAREELHLFASPTTKANGEVERPAGSLLATAWPVAERHFAAHTSASKKPGQMFIMFPLPEADDSFVEDIAASADGVVRPAILQRLPIEFRPELRFSVGHKLSYGEDDVPGAANFDRPEGSFEARAFGNTVHAFLEMTATRLAAGISVEALLREAVGWTSRIAAVLRVDGLHPSVIERLAPRVKAAITNMLQDDDGRWVLSQHKDSSNEFALTAWGNTRTSVRLDRVFLGGSRPMEAGSDYLWIIDYKTATHGRERLEEFLEEERAKYVDQMKVYAEMMKDRVASGKLRVGLHYPMLPKLIWWQPD
jgi:ATP-dependent helicase/nuclease subunit A